jgi:pimeloyl-ACP methyl ester carboxylesterase
MTTYKSFAPRVRDEVLTDLNQRLTLARFPALESDVGWSHGTSASYARELRDYWISSFNWRQVEDLYLAYENRRVTIDDVAIHFLLLGGSGPNPVPIMLTHGWPSSFLEMLDLAPRLADPVKYGGSPLDSFDVVVPSLPGFGFSDAAPPTVPTEQIWHRLMTEVLGYERYAAHGGDIGGNITGRLAMTHPEPLIGIHLTSWFSLPPPQNVPAPPFDPNFTKRISAWETEEGAYGHIQGTRPLSLAYGLSDSPLGLAGWIIEKFRAWSDCRGEVESRFTKEQLLANITLYWVTNSAYTSMLPYYRSRHPQVDRTVRSIEVPIGVAEFPADLGAPFPRKALEGWHNITRWTTMPRGGHFAAFEEPDLLADDIRTFFRPYRKSASHLGDDQGD